MKNRSPFHKPSARLQVIHTAATEAEILIYDEIGYWGITAKDFVAELASLGSPETIHVRINSPGGDVFDAVAIFNALRRHEARIVTHVDSVAASGASMVAMAGDEIQIADNGWLMIHNAWVIALGNAVDLRKSADVLDKIDGSLEAAYQQRSGATLEQVKAWMNEETWFTAQEALDAGFVDSMVPAQDESAAADIAARFDLSIFAHTPERLLVPQRADVDANPRDLEQALRDAGLSRAAAKTYVSAGRAAELLRDAEALTLRDAESKLEGRMSLSLAGMLLAAES